MDIPLAFCILTLFNEYDIDFLYANVVIVPFPYFYMCNYMHLSFIFVSILGTYHICSVFIPINVKATSLNSLKINKKSPNNEYSVKGFISRNCHVTKLKHLCKVVRNLTCL